MGGVRKRLGEAGWRLLLAQFSASGLTISAFCRQQGVCLASFRRWRGRLGSAGACAVARSTRQPAPAATEFVDLGAIGGESSRGRFALRLDLGDGLVLHLARG